MLHNCNRGGGQCDECWPEFQWVMIQINIVEATQMCSAAWKTLSATTIVNCFH